MSMETEYEGTVEFKEPEHPDRRIINRFFDQLGEGKRLGAAEELRALHAAGGSLCRADVELVADLLDGSACFGDVFPLRLEFSKRGRGRPRRSLESQLQAPWNAFASGDEVESSKALRKLDALGKTDVEILAGLLDDDPALHALFAWRLVLKCPKRGNPRTMRTGARQSMTAFIAAEARTRHEHTKRAVGDVCDRTGLSRATVYKAEKAMRDKSRIT